MMCLLPGGGYAEYVAVNRNHLIPVPKNISIEEVNFFSSYKIYLKQKRLVVYQKFGLLLI